MQVSYHGIDRVLCPHALGWKYGRPKLLAYQNGGRTSGGPLPADPAQRWRCLFVDEIERLEVVDGPWATWTNYSRSSSCVEQPPAHEVDL